MSRLRPSSGSPAAVWLCCALVLGAITAARFAVPNPAEAIGFLYVLPVCITAAELGRKAGMLAAAAALACILAWIATRNLHMGTIGFASRAAALFGTGLIVGWQRELRHHLQRDRERLIAELRELALQDQLTGLANRRAWDDRLDAELARAARTGAPLVVAAIDVDRLKELNDTAGHAAGDLLLKSCAARWTAELRTHDFLARIGGDEFALLLTDCDADGASRVAERLAASPEVGHTCSVGIAEWDRASSAETLMRSADAALYDAKRAGRGRVSFGATLSQAS